MTFMSRIPPLLATYLSPPPESSLILLTSVLGASTNWLVLRFLCAALAGGKPGRPAGAEELGRVTDGEVKVVLVSFLRDWEFWEDGGKRVGLDLVRLAQKGRLAFVDGLSGLFSPVAGDRENFVREKEQGRTVLRNSKLGEVEKEILRAIETLKRQGETQARVLLVLDGPDLLLAATEAEALAVGDLVAELRDHVHATLITASADFQLTQSPHTPLEINHAGFVTGLAHQASFTMSLRLLDTGTAKDVSGVLRVTRGPDDGEAQEEVEEREVLYYVGGDGGVRIFGRGE